jgi:hypothetical protein
MKRIVALLALVCSCSGCATALDVAKLAVNGADAAIGGAALVAEGRRGAAEDRCLELAAGPERDGCLEAVRVKFRPLWDAFGVWRLWRAAWDAAIGGGTAEELAAVRLRYCALRVELADRFTVPDWPTEPCS